MDGEQDTIVDLDPAAVAAAQAQPEPDPDEEVDTEDVGGDEGDGGEPAPRIDDDLEDVEWNGKTFKGPKGLKDGVLMHADYTRKTQEVASQRRELDATAKRVQEQARLLSEDLEKRAEYISIKKQMEQYQKVDWRQWIASDPVAAQQGQAEYLELQRQQSALAQELNQRAGKRAEEAQRSRSEDLARRLQETQDYARRTIKDWSPETDKQVVDYALANGVQMDDLRGAMNPTIYGILHKAMKFDQLASKPAAKPKPAAVAPLQTVGAKGNAPVRKSLSDMSMEEYAAHRKKQMAASG